jgi:hypothetical protein
MCSKTKAMKTKLRILIPLLLFAIPCIPQDIIMEKDGTQLWANILEYNKDEIKYKLYENPNGPVHVLSTGYVVKVIYDTSGRKSDSLEAASYLKGANPLIVRPWETSEFHKDDPMSINFNRHCVELNVTDFIAGILTMTYEHISNSGLFSYTIPFSIGLKSAYLNPGSVDEPPYNYYNSHKNYTVGLNLNCYPTGQGSAKYFLGTSFEFGSYYYCNVMDSIGNNGQITTETTQLKRGNYIAILFQNGINFQSSNGFNISLNCGVGWTENYFSIPSNPNSYFHYQNNSSNVAGRASICIGYKF